MAKALIRPTSAGTFGIDWSEHPWSGRGSYSGPYQTREEAEQGARDWCAAYEEECEITHSDKIPNVS